MSVPPDFLGLSGRTIVVAGVANRKSVGYHVGRALQEAGATVVWIVRTEQRREELSARLVPPGSEAERAGGEVLVCDVTVQAEIDALGDYLSDAHPLLHGLVHSIAFANYEAGPQPFHRTRKEDFLQAVDVSCFSLINLAGTLEDRFAPDASVVTISISSTMMAAENYGYMAPAKAALDSAVVFLAKGFSERGVRFNAVRAGLLKTASSAGIPGYVDSYLFAESCTLRKRALETAEVANTTLFLLSPRSSGINAQGIVVDAGMGVNYFDRAVVERATGSSPSGETRS